MISVAVPHHSVCRGPIPAATQTKVLKGSNLLKVLRVLKDTLNSQKREFAANSSLETDHISSSIWLTS